MQEAGAAAQHLLASEVALIQLRRWGAPAEEEELWGSLLGLLCGAFVHPQTKEASLL